GQGPASSNDDPWPVAQPLTGVRVLDLCRVWAGPMAARILAELGAEVIQVEAPWGRGPKRIPDSLVEATRLYPDNDQGTCQWNRNGHLIKYGLHKKSVVLDLTQERGAATFERLAAGSDVVIENYSPRVMPQLGLDEHRLHEVNPALIYMTMPGYGRSGPAVDWVAYGTTVDSHAGLSHLIGYPGQVPWKNGVAWPDPVAGLHAASAILIALWRRGHDGGTTIEGAQFEATLTLAGDALVEAQLQGRNPPVLGNRHRTGAPQGVYPAVGHDRWLALSVLDDDGWAALVAEARLPADLGRLDVDGRRDRHDELDAVLARWTAQHDPVTLANRLQELGVAAAPVLDAPGLLADPQLAARNALCTVDQPEAARFRNARLPVRFTTRPDPEPLRPAALLGEHNIEVLTEVAGLSRAEIAALEADGIVATEPPL
ncbi:MAG: CoA transferase, partial [Actinomycetota bacterium]